MEEEEENDGYHKDPKNSFEYQKKKMSENNGRSKRRACPPINFKPRFMNTKICLKVIF